MKKEFILILSLFAIYLSAVYPQRRTSIPLKHGAHRVGKRTDAEMQRWREHGLGQFIHWGVYSIPGGQWKGQTSEGAAEWFRSSGLISYKEYDNLYKQFNPVNFDANKWAKQAKNMGARYVIFTTKHHDGFCLWPSKYTDYTISNSSYKKDIVGAIVDAYTKEGIDVHLYFSIIDWSHPGYRSSIAETDEEKIKYEDFKKFTRNQLVELLTNYPQIKGLWFDGSWDMAWVKESAWVDTLGLELRAMHPGLVIGSRFRADENGKRHYDSNGDLIDDYDQTFERNLPKSREELNGNDWDCVMTIPENQWGYHCDWSLMYVKTPYDLIEMMMKANSMDGNFVINFGPDDKGNIRPEETKIASEIGKWMSINCNAVYGVQHSILEKQDWGTSTQNGDDIYLTVFNKPMSNILKIKVPKSPNKNCIYVIENAIFISSNQKAVVRDGGKDKSGSLFYDIPIPSDFQNCGQPFVLKINLKEVDKGDKAAYQKALT